MVDVKSDGKKDARDKIVGNPERERRQTGDEKRVRNKDNEREDADLVR